MTDSEDMDFCPKCGKVLIAFKNKFRCPKCKLEFSKIRIGEKRNFVVSSSKSGLKIVDTKLKKKTEVRRVEGIKNHTNKTKQNIESIDRGWEDFFPYINVRPQQKLIIETIIEAKDKRHIIVQAANGVGKTISLLSSLLPIAIKKEKTIIYCCRTHEQMDRIAEELKLVRQLTEISAITLRGRKELCLNPLIQKFAIDARNAADICSYLKKDGKCEFFKNLADRKLMQKTLESLHNKVVDNEELLELGELYQLCPYELSKKALLKANVIATSYQYVFNPHIRDTFLNHLDKGLNDIILVIDEAHNLPATAVEISSDSLSAITIENALTEAGKQNQGYLYDVLEAIATVLKELSADLKKEQEISYDVKRFLKKVEQRARIQISESVVEALAQLGEMIKEEKLRKQRAPLASSSSVARYLNLLLETADKSQFAHFISLSETKGGLRSPRMITLSLDPRIVTKEVLDRVFLSVSASGTLDPVEAYISLTGLDKRQVSTISLKSPYEKENIQTLVIQNVSTKLDFRNQQNYRTMIEVMESVINSTPKNVGVFCASYTVLESLLENGLEKVVTKPLYIAYRGMSSKENDQLVKRFKDEAKRNGAVLLSVLGGRSSEGSDYPAEQMHSVIIVGIPFARPNPKIKATINYLDAQFPGKGREFGYNIPAMRRAAQAAGRPIRGLEDFATIVLLDYRFGISYYRQHLPKWITQNMRVIQPDKLTIKKLVEEFFSRHK
ncbi:MAG: helicase C-terminal domain-containing protein [Candidatus Heimdallarchaeaceae archaeon]